MQELLEQAARELGNTPTIETQLTVDGVDRSVGLKLEAANPTGSVKARTAYSLVSDLFRQGRLTPDSRLIESTSGNLGVALADLARRLGIGFTAVVDPALTEENLALMQSHGASIERVTERDAQGGYLLTRLAKLAELRDADGRYVWTNQYGNPANPAVHYETTAPELIGDGGTPPDAVFVAVSTGGTVAGVAHYVADTGADCRVVAVDVEGSSAMEPTVGRRPLSGIGASRPSEFLATAPIASYQVVSTAEAVGQCRAILKNTSICLGGSSGAVVAACVRAIEADPTIRRAVCLCADSGEKYLSTVYNDVWLEQNHIVLPSAATGALDERRALSLTGVGHAPAGSAGATPEHEGAGL